jgi:deoxyxylulose-5-phosphate synthase
MWLYKIFVIFCLDREAGLVGEETTHHGVFDLAALHSNMIIYAQ